MARRSRDVGGFTIDFKPFQAFLKVMDRNVNKDAREALKHEAKEIVGTARWYAPRLKWNLERTIKLAPIVANQFSMRITITVGGSIGGVDVTKYAAMVHEFPWEKRGPITRSKGPQAGPRYLSRALRDHKNATIQAIGDATAKAIKDAARQTGVNRRRN